MDDEAYDEYNDYAEFGQDDKPAGYVLVTKEQLNNKDFMEPLLKDVLAGKKKFFVRTRDRNYEPVVVEQGWPPKQEWPTAWNFFSVASDPEFEPHDEDDHGVSLEEMIKAYDDPAYGWTLYYEAPGGAPAPTASHFVRRDE